MVETQGKAIVTSALQSKATEIDERHRQLAARREAILQEMQQKEIADSDIASMVEFGRNISFGLDKPTPELKRHWLELLQTKVTVADSKVKIECVIGKESAGIKNFDQFKAQAKPEVIAAGPKI